MNSLPGSPPLADAEDPVAVRASADAADESALLPPSPIDLELLRRAGRNEPEAWQTLMNHFTADFQMLAARLVSQHARRHGLETRRQLVKDLMQSAWVHLAEQFQNIERHFDPGKGTLSGFIHKAAHNRMVDHLRKTGRFWSREVELEAQVESGILEADPQEQPADTMALSQIEQLLKHRLKPEDRELLMRVMVNNESITAIAEEEGTQRNTLYQRLSRAKKQIREWLFKPGLPGQE